MANDLETAEKGDSVHQADAYKGTAHDAAEKGHVATDQ